MDASGVGDGVGWLPHCRGVHGEARTLAWRKRRACQRRTVVRAEAVLQRHGERGVARRLKECEIFHQRALALNTPSSSLPCPKANRQ